MRLPFLLPHLSSWPPVFSEACPEVQLEDLYVVARLWFGIGSGFAKSQQLEARSWLKVLSAFGCGSAMLCLRAMDSGPVLGIITIPRYVVEKSDLRGAYVKRPRTPEI